jgi:PKD repeat protein
MCSVSSWTDTEIKANCGTVAVEVSSVFGTASQLIESLDQVNEPPVANVGLDKSTRRNVSVKLDGRASRDPDGRIASYQWNFGDGKSGSGKVVYHKYTTRGTFTVTLTVTDDKGATGADTARVRVR